jgi:simple sugar transport system permease protein
VSATEKKLPRIFEILILPGLNLVAALFVSGLVVWSLGEDPFAALTFLIEGAFGYQEAVGYTFYYATNFIFTGLAVSVAYHAGYFNIGGEGQAMIGGVGLALAVFWLGDVSPMLAIVAGVIGSAVFGAAWAFIPAWLQAYRGSHIVITTIMFNFIASALLAYLLVGPLQRPGGQMPESSDFPDATALAQAHDVFALFGIEFEQSPLNISFLIALVVAFGVWFLLQRTRFGYELRVTGQNPDAAKYAGISQAKITVIALMLSGGLAGMMGINELLGEQMRLIGNFTLGYGFVGIAVAFMGRNHPLGIVVAAILFGAVYQGGAELGFEMTKITRDMTVVIQGFVILFAGAMPHLFRRPVQALYSRYNARGND